MNVKVLKHFLQASSDNETLHHVPEDGLKPDLCGYPNMLDAELPEHLDVYDDDGSLSDTSMDSPDTSPRDLYAEAYPTTQVQNCEVDSLNKYCFMAWQHSSKLSFHGTGAKCRQLATSWLFT